MLPQYPEANKDSGTNRMPISVQMVKGIFKFELSFKSARKVVNIKILSIFKYFPSFKINKIQNMQIGNGKREDLKQHPIPFFVLKI